MKKKKAVVLLSGGLDSTVALWWARRRFDCLALSFDYGQRHKKELAKARALAKLAHAYHWELRFQLPWSGSSLTDSSRKLPSHSLAVIGQHKIPSTYVPGRNTLFLSYALSLVDQVQAEAIVIGANALDYSGYPDCRPNFLKSFEKVAQLGSRLGTEKRRRIKILAPLLHLSKADIVRLGRRLGAPIDLTWSCYKGGVSPCHRCDSCRLRDKGFAEADGRSL